MTNGWTRNPHIICSSVGLRPQVLEGSSLSVLAVELLLFAR
jgi:hypothetical protein